MIAKVVVDITHKKLNQTYDYFIPSELKDKIKVGMRVVVNFNFQNRLAYVVEISETSKYAEKYIGYILDEKPTLTKMQMEIISLIQKKSFAPYNSAFKAVIPEELSASYEYDFIINDMNKLPIYLHKYKKNNKISLKDVDEIFLSEFDRLVNNKTLIKQTKVLSNPKIYYDKLLTITNKEVKLTYKQQEIVDKINKPTLKQDLINQGYSKDIITRLINNEVLSYELVEQYKTVNYDFTLKEDKVTLTSEQQKILDSINLNKYNQYLIYGPPASGKTEIILNITEELLKKDKQILILVPEISLIPQTVSRIKQRFNINPVTYHSKMSKRERYETYRRVQDNLANIVVGTRSSIFLPFKNLGIVMFDEAHDLSYIQKETPYYDAKEIASFICEENKIPLLYLTATPTVTMEYLSNFEIIKKLTLSKPVHKLKREVLLVDMKEELIKGNTSILSKRLQDEISKRLKNNEQIIILVNRKGYAPFLLCRTCGHARKCPTCDVSLVYHKHDNKFKCHHCNYSEDATTTCPECKSNNLKPVGFGVEQVEETLTKTFKDVKIIRMDSTTTTRKDSHDQLLSSFLKGEANILLGTQMVSKGHHFENVSLVAVLLADQMLQLSSYLSHEKTYALLTQHIGRIRTKDGLALIQTYNTDHFVLQSIVKNDYKMYYNNELNVRRALSLEPFYNVVKITFKGKNQTQTYNILNKIKQNITAKNTQAYVVGPTEEYIFYKNERYYYSITIKTPKTTKIDFLLNYIDKKYYEDYLLEIDYYPDQI